MAVTEPSLPAGVNTAPAASSSATSSTPQSAAVNGHAPAAGATSGPSAASSQTRTSDAEIRAAIAALRDDACERYRPQTGVAAPIRLMARMVNEIEAECRERGYPREIVASEVVNRTIGDVDLRGVSATLDGPEFVPLADEMGLALPGEQLDGGYVATGDTYRWIHERMLDFERRLLARHFDLRMYDVLAVGNPLLREMIRDYAAAAWGYPLPIEQIYLSLGALDGLDKFFRGYAMSLRKAGAAAGHGQHVAAIAFPAPCFNVPEWQAESLGLRLHRLYTRPEDHFKVTPAMLREAIEQAPDLRALYLTVSNNPTAFAYTPDEIAALYAALDDAGRDVLVVADLAYIGTGVPAEDRARMDALLRPEALRRTVYINSFSKTHTLTGDRCGWVGFGDPALAQAVSPGWTNSTASLPADWQLRYMAYIQLFTERPEIGDKIRALYAHRRARFIRQLQRMNERTGVFAHVNADDGGTVYNWSQLRPGEDVFTLFSATGIAGVPGGGFGYSDDFVRFSIGCIPVPDA